jgi:hypothetical protein
MQALETPHQLIQHVDAWPHGRERIAIWVNGSVEQVLIARRVAALILKRQPTAKILLFGARALSSFLEMDSGSLTFIPLGLFEPAYRNRSRWGQYWLMQSEFKQLRLLNLQASICVCGTTTLVESQLLLAKVLNALKLKQAALYCTQEHPLDAHADFDATLLQAGPEALAYSNRFYKMYPPTRPKVLLVLGETSEPASYLKQQWAVMQAHIESVPAAYKNAFYIPLLVSSADRLKNRQLKEVLPMAEQVSWAQVLGHLAYADWVVSTESTFNLICQEMGRGDRLVLIK